MKYLLRLIVLPFVFGIVFVFSTYKVFFTCFLFMKYGGEMNTYNKKCNRKTLIDVFDAIYDLKINELTKTAS